VTATDEFALEGKSAPPMTNGELVFEAPWQGRAFGIARALAEQGLYAWDDFRDSLIAEIRRSDTTPPTGSAYAYYDRFLAALEAVLVQRGVLAAAELRRRVAELAARPDGHDHDHDHHHDH
jgi:nitrile hydratase accessory protein